MLLFSGIIALLIMRVMFIIGFGSYGMYKESGTKYIEKQIGIQASLNPIYIDFPHLRRDIAELIHYESSRFVVFIDVEGDLDWETKEVMDENIRDNEVFHYVLANVDVLIHQAGISCLSPEIRRSLMWHLGRAIVLVFDGQEKLARDMVVLASKFSYARLLEQTRKWQQMFYLIIYILTLLSFALLYNCLDNFGMEVKTVINAVLFGCTGAVISGILNLRKFCYSGGAGRYMQFLQVMSRYVTGSIGAWFLTMLFQTGIIFHNFQGMENEGSILAVIGVIGGFSERMVPSLLEKFTMEGEISNDDEGSSATGKSREPK